MSGLDYAVRDKVLWMALLALCLVSAAIYVFWALPAMPDTVPVHWGVGGVADGWDSKGSTVFMGVVTLASALFSSTYPAVTLVALLVALLGGTALVALYSFLLWKGAIR